MLSMPSNNKPKPELIRLQLEAIGTHGEIDIYNTASGG
jgi:hypothetical protein